jgi:hypothetical protein
VQDTEPGSPVGLVQEQRELVQRQRAGIAKECSQGARSGVEKNPLIEVSVKDLRHQVRRAKPDQDFLVLDAIVDEAPAVGHPKRVAGHGKISENCAQACFDLPEVMAMYFPNV